MTKHDIYRQRAIPLTRTRKNLFHREYVSDFRNSEPPSGAAETVECLEDGRTYRLRKRLRGRCCKRAPSSLSPLKSSLVAS